VRTRRSRPVHAHLGADPRCWLPYGELQDWRNSLRDDGVTKAQHLVDTNGAQHATNLDRRNQQSAAVHLMSLCESLEFVISGRQLRTMIGTWTHRDYPILQPAPDHYALSVRDVADAVPERRSIVQEMARTTWDSWAMHHGVIRSKLSTQST